MSCIEFTCVVKAQVSEFLKNQEPPKGMARSSYYKFMKRYNDGTWTIKNDKVYHNDKEVVPQEDVEALLEKL